jgi:predicted enzyme related to lactoylglutathione lyase
MPSINAVTLIVNDPSAVAHRLADSFGWTITQDFGVFAELSAGDGALVWLNVPADRSDRLQQGVVIHAWVDDVDAAVNRARAGGAVILKEPTKMDFGMESAWAQVEGGPIVDLTRPI